MGLAVDLPGESLLHGPGYGPNLSSSSPRKRRPEGCEMGSRACKDRQAGHLSYIPAFFRYPPAGGWVRYPDHPGISGAQGCFHNHDLHPRPEPGRPVRSKPGRYGVNGSFPIRSLSPTGLSRILRSLTRSTTAHPFTFILRIQMNISHLPENYSYIKSPHFPLYLHNSFRQPNSR